MGAMNEVSTKLHKPAQTAKTVLKLHAKWYNHPPSLYINIFIFNTKYIINSLITLVFSTQKKKKKV